MDGVNPANLFGGSWIQISEGRVLVGQNSSDERFNIAGDYGGEYEHTLSINEMPEHLHSVNISERSSINPIYWGPSLQSSTKDSWGFGYKSTEAEIPGNRIQAAYTGGSASHNNIQPYLTCYIFQRIA